MIAPSLVLDWRPIVKPTKVSESGQRRMIAPEIHEARSSSVETVRTPTRAKPAFFRTDGGRLALIAFIVYGLAPPFVSSSGCTAYDTPLRLALIRRP